jgi:pimeloyl-ACP methyl ester carboxylesterase
VISPVRCHLQSSYDGSVSTSGQANLGAGAFSAAPSTIVLIHGLWLTPRSWERWSERYEDLGYRVLAPSWPGMESEVEALNADPSALAASLTVEQIVDHYESIVIEIERPPIVMGHSVGGTFTQILLDRGLGAAGVAVASVTVEGTRDIPFTTIKVAPPALGPFREGEPVLLTAQEFHYAFANTMSREESNALFARYVVPAPGGLLTEHAFTHFRRARSTRVAVDREARAPLLFIGFGEDHVMPPKLVHPDVETSNSSSVTEFVGFPGRPHFLGAPGWESVADYALAWAVEHASRSTAPAEAVADDGAEGESS